MPKKKNVKKFYRKKRYRKRKMRIPKRVGFPTKMFTKLTWTWEKATTSASNDDVFCLNSLYDPG